jgi:hypothetical protein
LGVVRSLLPRLASGGCCFVIPGRLFRLLASWDRRVRATTSRVRALAAMPDGHPRWEPLQDDQRVPAEVPSAPRRSPSRRSRFPMDAAWAVARRRAAGHRKKEFRKCFPESSLAPWQQPPWSSR